MLHRLAFSYASTDVEADALEVKIQAASVNTGSGMKDGKLKQKDFFDVKDDPLITFHSGQDYTDRSEYL